jgi:D-sedoheptulose 7-phosphate isomerase
LERKLNSKESIEQYLLESGQLVIKSSSLSTEIAQISGILIAAIKAGNKILWCGNGGSAADAQHLAAELVGRYKLNRKAIASIALTTDTSILTAVANDFGYDLVFARQIEAIGTKGDVLIALTTSGKSTSILNGLLAASARGIHTVLMTGKSAPQNLANYEVRIDSERTEMIQQCHTAIGHIICELVEANCAEI